MSQTGLLKEKRFLPLFVTQFLGAFNDNVIKNALVVLLTFKAVQWTSLRPEVLTNLAMGVFIFPFFILSATSGKLADTYDKAKLAVLVKVLEVLIVLVVAAALATKSLHLVMVSLFLLGSHSTLFGPIKYAILPQHLHEQELVGGNALIEAGTFGAILLGTLAGGLLAGSDNAEVLIVATGLLVAVAGLLTSRHIPSAPPEAKAGSVEKISFNIVKETLQNLSFARKNQTVFLSILGISWFWLYGALILAQLPSFAKVTLHGSESTVTILLALFTFGVGIGSLTCEKLSSRQVELGLVPLGSIGMSLFGFDLGLQAADALSFRLMVDLVLLGFFGGLYIVPLYALVQLRSEKEHRARIIAANNIQNALFMVIGAGAAAGLLSAGLSIPELFMVAAVCNLAVAAFIYTLVPEFLLRFAVWVLVHLVYRLDKRNLIVLEDLVAQNKPFLVTANHVSFVDALIIAAIIPRPLRFIMDHNIFKWPLLGYLFRASKAIPIAPAKEDPVRMEAALTTAARALDQGDIVGIFPEGGLTNDGTLKIFKPGYVRILDKLEGPRPVIVPIRLDGLWGSFFSRVDGTVMKKPFRRGLFSKVTVIVGDPVSPDTTPDELRTITENLVGRQT